MFWQQLAVVLAQHYRHKSVILVWHRLGSNTLLRMDESQGPRNRDRSKATVLKFGSKADSKAVGGQNEPESPDANAALGSITGSGACGFCFLYMSSMKARFTSSVLRIQALSLFLIRPLQQHCLETSERVWTPDDLILQPEPLCATLTS